jgi:hypothetical protein
MNRVSGFHAAPQFKRNRGIIKKKKQDRFHPKVRLILQAPFLNLPGVYIFIFL